MIKRSPILSDQLCDIQGMLNSGFGWLTESRFWLLTIRDGQEHQARAWLAKLVRSGLVVSAKRVRDRKKNERTPITEAVAIAFSYSRLAKLGFRETSKHPFPTPFRSGMGSPLRESLLRDIPRQQWRWSDVEGCEDRQTVLSSSPTGGCQTRRSKCRFLTRIQIASRPLKPPRLLQGRQAARAVSVFATASRNL